MTSRAASSRLELDPEAMRRLGYRVVDLLVEHHAGLHARPVAARATRERLEALLREPAPEGPTPPDAVLDQLLRDVLPHMMHASHPRFFAYVPGPSNFVGAMGDALASGFNVINTLWLESAGPAQLELVTVDWLRGLAGLPAQAGGHFVSGGTVANLTGLAVARRVMLDDRPDGVLYRTDQTHGSLAKGLRLLGFADASVRRVPVDAHYRMDPVALERLVDEDRAAGRRPFCVIANAGTTNTGAVDPLERIAGVCEREALWLHVDGAYGAPAVLTERGRALLRGIERAHSLALDPHKWLFQPFEIGCVLVRDASWLPRTFGAAQEYLQDAELDPRRSEVNFCDHGIQLTRGFRALKLWMSLKTFGLDAFRAAIEHGIERAEQAQALIRSRGCFELVTPAQLGVITFRYLTEPGIDADAVNAAIAAACMDGGYAMVSSTRLGARTVLRLCTINPRTTPADIEATVALLASLGARAERRG